MYDERPKFQITKMPRYQRKRFNPLPYIGAVGGLLAFVIVVVAALALHPWASGAAPTPLLTPIPSFAPLPTPTQVAVETPTDEPTEAADTPEPGASVIVYIVQRNDRFNTIAAKFHLTPAELLAANPQIKNPNNIFVGERIYVPLPAPTAQATPTPVDTSVSTATATATPTPTPTT